MKTSLFIVSFFVLGCMAGYFVEPLDGLAGSNLSVWALALLMFLVGVSMGRDREIISKMGRLDKRITLLPVITVAGTLAGAFIASLLLDRWDAEECATAASGLGYYSMASILVSEYRGAALGAVTLLANLLRELLSMLLIPMLVKRCGPLAPEAVSGAASIDTTLPIIVQCTGSEFAVVALCHGFICTLLVPLLISLFCAL